MHRFVPDFQGSEFYKHVYTRLELFEGDEHDFDACFQIFIYPAKIDFWEILNFAREIEFFRICRKFVFLALKKL